MRSILITLLILVSPIAFAETNDSHRRAAETLLERMDVESTIAGGSEVMAEAMTAQNPMLRPYRSVIVDWAIKSFTWANFESKFVDIYVDSFSEPEIRDLISFYETPTGKKLVRLQPELMRKGALLGAAIGQENSELLDTMIRERAAELDDASHDPN